jgi:hypothetical protein
LALAGCGPVLRDGRFVKGALSYRVAEPPAPWRRMAFADNDLAWGAPEGHVLALNATCTGHEDPPLDVLTRHLLMGFDARQPLGAQTLSLDGRAALRSRYEASLDGVPVELQVVVLKKNGCVHDLTYVAPAGQAGVHQAQFEALVTGFTQEHGP